MRLTDGSDREVAMADDVRLDGHARRKRRRALTPDEKLRSESPVVRLEGRYEIEHERVFGFRPALVAPARDRKRLLDLLATWDEDEIARLMPRFLRRAKGGEGRLADLAIRSTSLTDFVFWCPRLRLQESRREVAPRTAENLTEAAKAMGTIRWPAKEES